MLAYEFCKETKLHLDQLLSEEAHAIDISLLIKVLRKTQDFERQLVTRFKPGGNRHETVFEGRDGDVEIEVGSAEEIRAKYAKDQPEEEKKEDSGFGFDKGVAKKKRTGKTVISAHIYRFDNCISECFEPYL